MAASLGNAVGAIGGISKYYEGRKMQKRAQRFIDNFEWQDLNQPYANLQVSTMGSDLQREEAARMSATAVDTVRSGGSRGIIGGMGQITAQNNLINRQIGADLDQQQKAIDYAEAQDAVMRRMMIERRQADELAGYGQMLNTGLGMKYQGVTDMMNVGNQQSQHNMQIMQMIMGGMSGGGGGMMGGMMGGGGGAATGAGAQQ